MAANEMLIHGNVLDSHSLQHMLHQATQADGCYWDALRFFGINLTIYQVFSIKYWTVKHKRYDIAHLGLLQQSFLNFLIISQNCKGSTHAEQNYASIVSHLGNG
eukprot:3089748-Ditylum_brightwellii.AAC.1